MGNFRDLRQLVQHLEARGKLYRFKERVNKDTEIGALFRVQMRGLPDAKRKVLLFENVIGSAHGRYDMSVLSGIYGASTEILQISLGCENYVELLDKWHHGLANPIAPIVVDNGPVHEEVHTGDELQKIGLDAFPVPVEEPGFSGILRTGLPMITRDPATGIRNVVPTMRSSALKIAWSRPSVRCMTPCATTGRRRAGAMKGCRWRSWSAARQK